MFIGYMVHLVLDEIYSVDVLGTRVKRSFGTAVKFYDGRRIDHSVAMAVATVAALMLTPPTKTFVDGVSSLDGAGWTVRKGDPLFPKDQRAES